MKKFLPKIKSALLVSAITSSITFTTLSLAGQQANFSGPSNFQSNPSDPIDTKPITDAINNLNNQLGKQMGDLAKKMEALAKAGIKAVNNAANQIDQNLPNILQVNPQTKNITEQVQQQAFSVSQKSIKDTLHQISDVTLTFNGNGNGTGDDDVKQALKRIENRKTHIDDLTANAPASDTIYSAIPGIAAASINNGYSVAKPSAFHDEYFDFGSLITPQAYTPDQQKAVQNYIEFITQSYKPVTEGIDFTTLKAQLDQMKPDQLASAIHNFQNTPAFRNYQLSVRSAMANQSIAINNFAQIVAERNPLTNLNNDKLDPSKLDPNLAALSNAVGVKPYIIEVDNPNNPGKKIKIYAYASPLQITSYMATHRVNNSQWYQQMASASPAAVQREALYVLAEIESQLHQAHIDQQRMLATLTALQMQSGASNQMMLKTQANDVNQAIKDIGSANSDGSNADSKAAADAQAKFKNNNATGADAYKQQQQQQQPKKDDTKK